METRYRYGENETLPFGEADNLTRISNLIQASRPSSGLQRLYS